MAYIRNFRGSSGNRAIISGSNVQVTGSLFGSAVSGTTAQFTSLTGTLNGNITGNAATVTNGIYTNTSNTFTGINTFNTNYITGSITGSDAKFTSITGTFVAPLGSVTAPSYTFSGDTNTGIYSPAADTIAFVEGGVEAMRISSSGDIGLGVTSPQQKLHIDGNIRLGFGNSNCAIIGDGDLALTAESDLLLVSDLNRTSSSPLADIIFGGGGYDAAEDATYTSLFNGLSLPRVEHMRIVGSSSYVGIGTTNPTNRLDVVGTGRFSSELTVGYGYVATNLTIANGDLVIGTSGKGISFASTAGGTTGSLGTIDSELLNDYEEGAWTVGLSGSTTGGTYSYAVGTALNQGHYVKIGSTVFVTGYITASATTPLTGNVCITGLPFISSGAERDRSFNGAVGQWNGFSTSVINLIPESVPGANFLRLMKFTAATTSNTGTRLVGTDLSNTNIVIRFSHIYNAV